jgi:type II secretory pathway pseudopilin PulG
MKFDGQSQSGYAMAALLVAMSVMAVLMTVVMPVWRQAAQREKEEELVFRGLQYTHAIGLYERKYANTPPPTVDVLTQEHFLRKKFKDPITNADFVVIPSSQAQTATAGTGTAPATAGTPTAPAAAGRGAGAQTAAGAGAPAGARGGVIGVTSASTSRSIRIYNGGTRYSEWRFIYAPPAAAPGAGGAPATGGAAGRGTPGRPVQPGQLGQPGGGRPGGPNGPGRGLPPGGPNRGAGSGPGGGLRGGPPTTAPVLGGR